MIGSPLNERIHNILAQISALEDELHTAIAQQQTSIFFQIKGKRVEFERSVRLMHRRMKKGFFRWLVTNRPLNLITGPIIYSMIFPMLILDVCVSFYQMTCFPIYRIPKVKRSNYIVMDRQQLAYLNWIEKFHCSYCAYGAGLIAYVTEIVGRTEQYFCPIKHARKVLGSHEHYRQFLEYGDATDYHKRLEELRVALEKAS